MAGQRTLPYFADNFSPPLYAPRRTIDPSLFGSGFRFDAHWVIVRTADNQAVDDFWWSGVSGYPQTVDRLPGSNFWISLAWNQASDANVNSGGGGNAEGSKEGMDAFRAYFFVDTSTYSNGLYRPNGTSEFCYRRRSLFLARVRSGQLGDGSTSIRESCPDGSRSLLCKKRVSLVSGAADTR